MTLQLQHQLQFKRENGYKVVMSFRLKKLKGHMEIELQQLVLHTLG